MPLRRVQSFFIWLFPLHKFMCENHATNLHWFLRFFYPMCEWLYNVGLHPVSPSNGEGRERKLNWNQRNLRWLSTFTNLNFYLFIWGVGDFWFVPFAPRCDNLVFFFFFIPGHALDLISATFVSHCCIFFPQFVSLLQYSVHQEKNKRKTNSHIELQNEFLFTPDAKSCVLRA